MSKPEFVYTTYIRTTPKQLWQALTEPAFTTRYWGGMALESDWQTGSVFTVTLADGTRIADPAQVVVAADPYRRLAYTWHTFTPEWAAHYNIAEEDRDRTMSLYNVTVHVLTQGDRFAIKTRTPESRPGRRSG